MNEEFLPVVKNYALSLETQAKNNGNTNLFNKYLFMFFSF